jgi:hypothetical protein
VPCRQYLRIFATQYGKSEIPHGFAVTVIATLANMPPSVGNIGDSRYTFGINVYRRLKEDHSVFSDVIAYAPLSEYKTAVRFADTPEEIDANESKRKLLLRARRGYGRHRRIAARLVHIKAAALIPARRAASIDPIQALRSE